MGIKLSVVKIKKSQFLGLVSYKLIFKDNTELKVDFNFYPFPRIAAGQKYKNVDLYFIFKKLPINLKKMILDAKAKFDWHIDPITLGSQFVKVKGFTKSDLPKMLKPFDKKDMEAFFLKLAKSLEKDIFK